MTQEHKDKLAEARRRAAAARSLEQVARDQASENSRVVASVVSEEHPGMGAWYDFKPEPGFVYEYANLSDSLTRMHSPMYLSQKRSQGWVVDAEDPDLPGRYRIKIPQSEYQKLVSRSQSNAAALYGSALQGSPDAKVLETEYVTPEEFASVFDR